MSATTIAHLGATATLTLDEATAALQRLQHEYAVIPAHALANTTQMLRRIRAAADDATLSTVGELLKSSGAIIADVSGVSNVTAFHTDADSAKLHTARNTLAALTTAAYVDAGHEPGPSYTALPTLKMRTHLSRRPLEDDEVLLCRLHALHLLRTGNPTQRRNGAAYVVADAGLPPTEATALRIADLILDGSQPLLMMAANRTFDDRIISLETFHTTALRQHLARLDGEQVTYRPRTNLPGTNQAAASMHGVLGRILGAVGITGDDLTASCVYTWGLRRILDHNDVSDALLAAGLSSRNAGKLLKLIGRTDDHPTTTATSAPEHAAGF